MTYNVFGGTLNLTQSINHVVFGYNDICLLLPIQHKDITRKSLRCFKLIVV